MRPAPFCWHHEALETSGLQKSAELRGAGWSKGASLEAEKEHLLDQIAPLPDLPDFGDLIKVLKNK